MSELDNLLDATLDDLQDLPSFTPFQAGAYRVLATMEAEEISKKMGKVCIELSFEILEVMESADPNVAVPNEKDTANTLFMMANEYGQGNFKKTAAPIAEQFGVTKAGEIVEQCQALECIILCGVPTPDKKDPDKHYLNLKELQVL